MYISFRETPDLVGISVRISINLFVTQVSHACRKGNGFEEYHDTKPEAHYRVLHSHRQVRCDKNLFCSNTKSGGQSPNFTALRLQMVMMSSLK